MKDGRGGERSLQLDPTFLYGEPLLAALYRKWGASMMRSRYTKIEDISGRVPFGLAFTYSKMDRRMKRGKSQKPLARVAGLHARGRPLRMRTWCCKNMKRRFVT